jgi:hypothetical protein
MDDVPVDFASGIAKLPLEIQQNTQDFDEVDSSTTRGVD